MKQYLKNILLLLSILVSLMFWYTNDLHAQKVIIYQSFIKGQTGFQFNFDIKNHQIGLLLPFSFNNSVNIPTDYYLYSRDTNEQKQYGISNLDWHITPTILYRYRLPIKWANIDISAGPNINISYINNYYPKGSYSSFFIFNSNNSYYVTEREKIFKPGLSAYFNIKSFKKGYSWIGLYAMTNIAKDNSFFKAGISFNIINKEKS